MDGDPIRAARRIRRAVAEATVDAAVATGEDLLGKAQRGAPLDEGTLRAAGTLRIVVNGTPYPSATAAKAAAGAAADAGQTVDVAVDVIFALPYAARQHEETEWQHPKGGEAKYLERPLSANAARYGKIIEAAQRVALLRRT